MTQIDEREIRKRIEKRHKERQEFLLHLVIYGMVNVFLWIAWFVALALVGQAFDLSAWPYSALRIPWPLIVMLGWGIGLVAHGLTIYFKSARAEARLEQTVQREIEREKERLGLFSEKPKRDSRIRLEEDGELVYEDEEPAPRRARKS